MCAYRSHRFAFILSALLVLNGFLIKRTLCSYCDSTFYDPVKDCSAHPLKVGYVANSLCGSLHTLTDAEGRPNANFARLDHPASYNTGSGTSYLEYSAGTYLSIKLSKPAQIFGIALQGSPNGLRYYLKSFELWYKITINDFDLNKPANTSQGFYKENSATKRFIGDMISTTKFVFANPFYADEVRIYPIRFYGDRVFRVELYGCYLGRVTVPNSIGVAYNTIVTVSDAQRVNSTGNKYYVKVNEPDTTMQIITVNQTANYTFSSRGTGSMNLGLNYSSGWLLTDSTSFIVQGSILGLQLRLDGSSVLPFKKTENTNIEFRLFTTDQPYQLKRFSFVFGDSSSCDHNYCQHSYSRGLYNATGTAFNDFYQKTLQAEIIACPTSVTVAYNPVNQYDQIAISHLGTSVVHQFTVQFYALKSTSYDVWYDGPNIQNQTFNGLGTTVKQISLPKGLVAPSQHSLVFNYTDACTTRRYTATVVVDRKIAGVSIKLNQTFKQQLLMPVSYYFKNKPIQVFLDIENGTSIQCEVSTRSVSGSRAWHLASKINDKKFVYTRTFVAPGDEIVYIGGKCSNRLNLPDVLTPELTVDLREIPEQMMNFSLELSQQIVQTGESFYLYLIFLTGNKMNCTVSSITAGISQTYSYSDLITYQQAYSNLRKAYRLPLSVSLFSLQHRFDVTCLNVFNIVTGNITLQAQVRLSGLSMTVDDFVCYNASFNVSSELIQGAPIYKALFIDAVQYLDYTSLNTTGNQFIVNPSVYGDPGWKNITLRAWNNVSSPLESTKSIRIAENITDLDVFINFTLSSPQALPDRPNLVLPITETINFTAVVSPNVSGYLYNWTINETSANTSIPNWSYTFLSTGIYRLNLVVEGCNNAVYERYLTLISPVDDFTITYNPYPEVVVNKTTLIQISNARHSDCLNLDFGDGTSSMMHCKTYNTISDLNCFSENSTCQINHIYRSRGNFSIQVTASNGLYARVKMKVVMAKTCFNPAISMTGTGTDMTDVIFGDSRSFNNSRQPRSKSLHYNITSIDVNCEFSKRYSVTWKIYDTGLNRSHTGPLVMWNDPYFLRSNKGFMFGRNNQSLFVPCCFVNYGLFSVHVQVAMKGHQNAVGFVGNKVLLTIIVQSELIADISPAAHELFTYNSTIILNGTGSRDPDRSSSELTFTWYCRDTVLEPRDISVISNISLISISDMNIQQIVATRSKSVGIESISPALSTSGIVSSSVVTNSAASNDSNKKTVSGCFGKPVGRINVDNDTKVLTFNSMLLQENHTIEFTLVVEGKNSLGKRKSNTSKTLLVRLRETPYFSLRCSENCAAKLDPSGKFSLLANCQSRSCWSGAIFKWSMVENGLSHKKPFSLNNILYSKDSHKDLYMKPNVLTQGFNYTLTLKATAFDSSVYEQEYFIPVNEAPRNGSCVVDPNKGVAIYSKFFINCTGWIDTELPLLYEVAHVTELLTTVVCRQHDSSCRTIFPIGENVNSTLRIRVRIFDSMKMFTEKFSTVQVTAPEINLTDLKVFVQEIQNASASQHSAQRIGAVASVLNAKKNKSEEMLQTSIKIRDASIELLSAMVNTSSDDVIAPLIAMVAMVPQEFTQVSGNIATQASIKMTNNLVKSHSSVIFRDLISRSKSLLAAMGMVMKSTSVNLDPNRNVRNESNVTENPLKWITEQGRLIVVNSSSALNLLIKTVFSRMSPYEIPVRILTLNLGMVLMKKYGYEFGNSTEQQLMNGKIILPSLKDLSINQSLIISTLMKVSNFNSFFWGPKSKLINSSLVEFSFRSNEEVLSVTNTKQKIQLSVPRYLSHQLPYQHWLFQERANSERVNFHELEVKNGNSIHIEFKPMNYCSSYNIYIKHGSRPSRDNYDRNWTIPNLSLCNSTGLQDVVKLNICETYKELVPSSLTYGNNETTPNLNCTLKDLLERRIKEITSICTLDPYRLFMLDTETKDGIYYIGVYDSEGPSLSKVSPAEMLNDTRKCQVADNVGEKSYYIRSYTTKCRYWDGSKENWLHHGCQVGEMTNASLVHCNCNHLTSFASDFFIAPNPIDIDKVIAGFKNIKDNVSVIVLISLLFGFYLLLVIALRKRDKHDKDKVCLVILNDDPLKSYEYLVITVTGARAGAGTTANVFCSLNNETQIGEPRLLYDPEKRSFQRDQINAFKIAFEKPIDDITDIRIWHDNKGSSPGWYLSRVYVEDIKRKATYLFNCEQWLAVEFEDGSIDRTIPLAGSDDNNMFSRIFTRKAAEDLSDQHLWLSVAIKRPHHTFTRVQRLTCCMALLFTTMLTSAMFFQLGNDSKYLWKIGSLIIDYKGIIIGIQSGLIAIPINAVIVALFRYTESLSNYKKRREIRKLGGEKSDRKKPLPCGFIIIAWLLSIAVILTSAVIVLFYSMQWGNQRSTQFVLSVVTGFLQSAFLIQPLKLVLVAFVLAAVFKKMADEKDVLDVYKLSENQKVVRGSEIYIDKSKMFRKPLTKEQLVYARKRRLMEVRLRLFLQDLISYLIFLLFLGFVVRGYRDPDAYQFSKALQDDVIHKHFHYIQDIPGLWGWVQNHFIPAVYSQTWYNGENFTNFKMLRNQEAFRIGLARIRQLRIKPGTCKLDSDVAGIMKGCNEMYSLSLNEERDFDVAWKTLTAQRRRRSVFNDNLRLLQLKPPGTDAEVDSSSITSNELFIVDMNDSSIITSSNELGVKEVTEDLTRLYSDEDDSQSIVYRDDFDNDNNIVTLSDGYDVMNTADSVDHVEEDGSEILRRSRRAIKFKIKRKTIPSASLLKHSNDIIIDSQYLLPDGRARPNKDHWKYNQASKLRGFPYYGKFALYSGGGYVASLATDIDYARAVAVALEQDSWVDTLTRAVFFEFSVYNANLNFFATGFIMVEVLPIGNIIPTQSIRVFKLYRYVGTFGRLVMASEIILVVALLFFIYKECRHMYRIGSAYFKQFWSWVEITIAVALFAAMILRGFSWYEGDKILTELTKDPNKYINFHYAVLADDALLIAITIICFASTLKILKIISIFPTVVVLKQTLRLAAKPLVNYALPFTILFCAFTALGNLLFWSSDLFSTYVKTAETQLMMLIGGSVYKTLHSTDDVFGPIFFLMFAAFETFIFMNVFVAILNDGIAQSADWNQKDCTPNEFIAYIEERMLGILNLSSMRLRKSTYQRMDTKRKQSRKMTMKDSRRKTSVIPPERKKSRFEILQQNEVIQRKLTLTLDNCDWVLDRLDYKVDRSIKEAHDDYESTFESIVKYCLQNTNKTS